MYTRLLFSANNNFITIAQNYFTKFEYEREPTSKHSLSSKIRIFETDSQLAKIMAKAQKN